MKLYSRKLLKVFLVLTITVGTAVSAYAQYQTPTSPSGSRSLGTNQRTKRTLGNLRDRQSNQTDSSQDRLSQIRERLRSLRGEKDGEAEGNQERQTSQQRPGAGTAPPAARGARPGGGATVVTPGGAAGAGAGAGAGVRTVGGAAGTGAPAGGAAAGVRVVGPQNYDPLFQRELEYKEVPPIPDAPPMTLQGPMTVGDFLETLYQFELPWNFLVTDLARAITLNFWISNVSPTQALEVLQFHDIWYEYNEETGYMKVMTKEEYLEEEFGEIEEVEFIVENANVEYIESVVQSLLSPQGRMLVDPRTRHLYVWDRKANLDRMEAALEELDVPLTEAEFQVEYAGVADIEAVLTALLSPGGTIITDPRTGRIVVTDAPDNIAQMRAAVTRFDVPLTPRVYPIRYMNALDLEESVQALLTPERGTMQIDPRTNTIIVTDLPSRLEEIISIIETLDQPLETRTWVLDYIEPEDVAERIENLVPEEMGNIITDETVHQLTVTATAQRIEEIEQMIRMWDVKRQQVLIEAYLVTLSSNLAKSFNINWTFFDSINGTPVAYRIGAGATPDYTSLNDTMTIGQIPFAQPLRNRFTGEPILNINEEEIIEHWRGDKLAATLNYLDTKGQATILSSPRVTVQDGAEAMFQSGRNVPYVTSTTYDYGSRRIADPTDPTQNFNYGYRPYNRIEFIEVGTILTVLPRISEDGSILLELAAEDSDATPVSVVSNGEENTIPEKTVSLAETQVRVNDGQTIVIGGLRRGNTTESVSRAVPLLSDLPVIGSLFRSPVKNIENDTLMIFLTITVVSEDTHPEAEHLAAAEEAFAEKMRTAEKNQLKRLWDKVTRSTNELSISIGQSGDMHSGGQRVTLEDLRRIFHELDNPLTTRVIVRSHPRAPQSVVAEVTELALEADLKVEFDDRLAPFVPDYPPPDDHDEKTSKGMVSMPTALPDAKVKVPAKATKRLVVKPAE